VRYFRVIGVVKAGIKRAALLFTTSWSKHFLKRYKLYCPGFKGFVVVLLVHALYVQEVYFSHPNHIIIFEWHSIGKLSKLEK